MTSPSRLSDETFEALFRHPSSVIGAFGALIHEARRARKWEEVERDRANDLLLDLNQALALLDDLFDSLHDIHKLLESQNPSSIRLAIQVARDAFLAVETFLKKVGRR